MTGVQTCALPICSTIFLFSGSQEDLIAQDKFGKFKALLGDGSYNSIEIKSWRQEGGI